jgi:hypothetical protein
VCKIAAELKSSEIQSDEKRVAFVASLPDMSAERLLFVTDIRRYVGRDAAL